MIIEIESQYQGKNISGISVDESKGGANGVGMSERNDLSPALPPVAAPAPGGSGLVCERTGSIALLVPLTAEAVRWVRERLDFAPWQWIGGRLAVEPDAADEIMAAWEAR